MEHPFVRAITDNWGMTILVSVCPGNYILWCYIVPQPLSNNGMLSGLLTYRACC